MSKDNPTAYFDELTQRFQRERIAFAQINPPRAATATFRHRLRGRAPVHGIKPERVGLPDLGAVEQNCTIAASIAEWCQVFIGIESSHSYKCSNTCPTSKPPAPFACCACRHWAMSP